MTANFLHGSEVNEQSIGTRPVRTVKSAVVAIIGTAPMGGVNALTQVLSDYQGAQFGPRFEGFTIPQALKAVFDQGGGTCIVVNVLDPTVHHTAITNETVTLDNNDTGTAAHPAWTGLPVVKNNGATVTYVKDTDYTCSAEDKLYGRIHRKAGGSIAANASLKISYDYADPTEVTSSDIIGTVNGSGVRTGLQALKDSDVLFGYRPKVIISPVFGCLSTVRTQLDIMADALGAVCIADAPIGTTYSQAIAGRGPAGAINFFTSSDRTILCYPHLKIGDTLEPMSQRLAGVICRSDIERGFWYSPSNVEIKGVDGVEFNLTGDWRDPNGEINLLNESGIVTYLRAYGTGIRAWGNRSAAWPTVTDPQNFIAVRRAADIINESLNVGVLDFIDKPGTSAWVDSVLAWGNAYLRHMISLGALVDGAMTFDLSKNPAEEKALGHFTFTIDYMPPTPAERITFDTYIDINLLSSVGAQ